MTSPALLKPASVATLSIVRLGFCEPGVVTSSHAFAAPPAPSSTQAWLKNLPASTSACVTVWLAVHEIDAPGARSATGVDGVQTRFGAFGSVTSTLCNVTLPLLLATTV